MKAVPGEKGAAAKPRGNVHGLAALGLDAKETDGAISGTDDDAGLVGGKDGARSKALLLNGDGLRGGGEDFEHTPGLAGALWHISKAGRPRSVGAKLAERAHCGVFPVKKSVGLPNLVGHSDLVGVLRLGAQLEVGPEGQDADEELGTKVGQSVVEGLEGVVVADGRGDLVEDGAGRGSGEGEKDGC